MIIIFDHYYVFLKTNLWGIYCIMLRTY